MFVCVCVGGGGGGREREREREAYQPVIKETLQEAGAISQDDKKEGLGLLSEIVHPTTDLDPLTSVGSRVPDLDLCVWCVCVCVCVFVCV